MVVLLQVMLAGVVVALVLWASARAGRGRMALLLAAGVLAAFFGPWLAAADWVLLGRVALWAALAGAVIGGYAWALARIRAAARERGGE